MSLSSCPASGVQAGQVNSSGSVLSRVVEGGRGVGGGQCRGTFTSFSFGLDVCSRQPLMLRRLQARLKELNKRLGVLLFVDLASVRRCQMVEEPASCTCSVGWVQSLKGWRCRGRCAAR